MKKLRCGICRDAMATGVCTNCGANMCRACTEKTFKDTCNACQDDFAEEALVNEIDDDERDYIIETYMTELEADNS